jgi:hypothetical protein
MNMIRSLGVSLALAAGLAGAAHAAPVPGTGGGYYGSAWYNSGQGSVVAGAPTWAACNSTLQESINHAVSNWGWWVVTYNPCKYRPPFGEMAAEVHAEKVGIEINAGSADESAGVVRVISDEIRRTREMYRADDYDNALRTIYISGSGR